jgi:hypothetical protein
MVVSSNQADTGEIKYSPPRSTVVISIAFMVVITKVGEEGL